MCTRLKYLTLGTDISSLDILVLRYHCDEAPLEKLRVKHAQKRPLIHKIHDENSFYLAVFTFILLLTRRGCSRRPPTPYTTPTAASTTGAAVGRESVWPLSAFSASSAAIVPPAPLCHCRLFRWPEAARVCVFPVFFFPRALFERLASVPREEYQLRASRQPLVA